MLGLGRWRLAAALTLIVTVALVTVVVRTTRVGGRAAFVLRAVSPLEAPRADAASISLVAATTTTTTAPLRAQPSAVPVARSLPAPASPQQRGAEALELIHYPWQQLGYSITFLGPRPGLLGGTIPAQREILAFVRPDESTQLLAHIVAHELGHAIDKTYNNDARRQLWLRLRGVSTSEPWFTCYACPDFATGSGDFAETFAYSMVGDFDHSQLTPFPDAAMLARLSPLFLAS
ncbi:MAG: hypothetical protein JO265_13095 [Acidimicrobiia bacterium]|nr:hypothetical protein [Acidimicrobiia bacterium]